MQLGSLSQCGAVLRVALPTTPPCGQAQAHNSAYRLWEEQELIDLCSSVGLEGYKRIRSFRYIMLAARKPQGVYM